MNITEILAKAAKGEALTDDEKKFAAEYNPQKDIDSAASGARRKAEKERDETKSAMEKLQAELDELREKANPDKAKSEKETLEKRIAKLEAAKAEAEAKATKLTRDARVRSLAKDAGVTAAKGIDSATFDTVVDALMAAVDLDDADAVKTAFDGFKKTNAGMIAAATVGGAGAKGTPGGAPKGPNPWKKDSFNLTKQIEMLASSPEEAKALMADAGVSEGE